MIYSNFIIYFLLLGKTYNVHFKSWYNARDILAWTHKVSNVSHDYHMIDIVIGVCGEVLEQCGKWWDLVLANKNWLYINFIVVFLNTLTVVTIIGLALEGCVFWNINTFLLMNFNKYCVMLGVLLRLSLSSCQPLIMRFLC